MPPHCPGEAYEQEATLFRACMEDPPTDEDYRPHNESDVPQKMRAADPNVCAGWGLSVWADPGELTHAREHVMPWMQRRFIFSTTVQAADGKLSPPGANGHYTYWPYEATDLRSNAVLFLAPQGN